MGYLARGMEMVDLCNSEHSFGSVSQASGFGVR